MRVAVHRTGIVASSAVLICFLVLRTPPVAGGATTPVTPLHMWDFRGARDTIEDRVGGITATLVNGNAACRTAHGIDLDGESEHLVINFGAVQLGGALTIEAVVQLTAFHSNSRIFDCGNGQLENIIVGNAGTTGQVAWTVMQGAIGKHVLSDVEMVPLAWSHIVTTIEGTDFFVYINGVQQGESSAGWEPNAMPRLNCYIGQSNWADGYFAGTIATLNIYAGAMTQKEAQQACLEEGVCKVPAVRQPTRLERFWDGFKSMMCFGLHATHAPTWCFPVTFTLLLVYVAIVASLACYACVFLPLIAMRRSFVLRVPCRKALREVCTRQCLPCGEAARKEPFAPVLKNSAGRKLSWCEWMGARDAHDVVLTQQCHFLTDDDLDFRETLIDILKRDVAASDRDILPTIAGEQAAY